MVEAQATITNALGLHARAAARFVRLAGSFASRVTVSKGTRSMDGKSIMGLLLLSAAQGTVMTIRAEGPDEREALQALVDLVGNGFSERP